MAVVFDMDSLIVDIQSGTVSLDAQTDLYEAWKTAVRTGYGTLGKAPPAFRAVAGDPVVPGAYKLEGVFFFRNDLGWRMRLPDENATVSITGYLTLEDTTQPFFVPRAGRTSAILGLVDIVGSAKPMAAAIDAILEDTGTAGVKVADKAGYSLSGTKTTLDALNDVSVSDVLAQVQTALDEVIPDTPMPGSIYDVLSEVDAVLPISGTLSTFDATAIQTESYAADGAAASIVQLLYMIWSLLAERGVNGTTLTAKRVDGSTTSMTFTLDHPTDPKNQTRAT